MKDIDPRTGRPFGDHGEGHHAIQFALEELDDVYDMRVFLDGWLHGDLEGWPEFYAWLKANE